MTVGHPHHHRRPPSSPNTTNLLLQSTDAKKQTFFYFQSADIWSTSTFAEEVLCRALGGKVGKSDSGWDIGPRKVNIVNSCSLFETLFETLPALTIIECHQDEVLELPIGAEVIGFSDKTGVEMFRIGNHILGVQGHPEYSKDILNNLIDRLLSQDSIEIDQANEARSKLEIQEPNSKCWQEICKAFLKGLWNEYPSIEQ